MRHIFEIQTTADRFGYTIGREELDIFMMFIIGIAFRIAAYLGLRFTNRDKQK